MNLSDEIRKQIEKNKGLKLAVGEINNHLSVLEGLVRNDIEGRKNEAYQKGFEDGKAVNDKGCEGCKYSGTPQGDSPCFNCSNYYQNNWTAKDDKIEVGDEVKPSYSDIAGVVTLVDGDTIYVLWRDGSSTSIIKLKDLCKTGRHFDIEKILEGMRYDD